MSQTSEVKIFNHEEPKVVLGYMGVIFLLAFVGHLMVKENPLKTTAAPVMSQPADEVIQEVDQAAQEEIVTPPEEKISPIEYSGLAGAMNRPADQQAGLIETCQMKDWGVQFACDLSLEVIDKNQEVIQVVLSKDPMVTLSWERFNNNVRFLGQLNRFFFEKFDFYQDGFKTESVQFAGHQAVLVKGYAKQQPDVQTRDYYYLYGDKLFGVFFRLSSIDKLGAGELVVKKAKDSFSGLP